MLDSATLISFSVAGVSDGQRAVATVEVRSHPTWAYEALWTSLLAIAGWLLLVGVAALGAAALAVRAWRRGLDDIVAQAHALQLGRFTSIAEPRTREHGPVEVDHRLLAHVGDTEDDAPTLGFHLGEGFARAGQSNRVGDREERRHQEPLGNLQVRGRRLQGLHDADELY